MGELTRVREKGDRRPWVRVPRWYLHAFCMHLRASFGIFGHLQALVEHSILHFFHLHFIVSTLHFIVSTPHFIFSLAEQLDKHAQLPEGTPEAVACRSQLGRVVEPISTASVACQTAINIKPADAARSAAQPHVVHLPRAGPADPGFRRFLAVARREPGGWDSDYGSDSSEDSDGSGPDS